MRLREDSQCTLKLDDTDALASLPRSGRACVVRAPDSCSFHWPGSLAASVAEVSVSLGGLLAWSVHAAGRAMCVRLTPGPVPGWSKCSAHSP